MPNNKRIHYSKPFTADQVEARRGALRPSVARVMALLDPEDPHYGKILAILRDMAASGIEIDVAVAEMAIKLARYTTSTTADAARTPSMRPLPPATDEPEPSIVYYIRRGDLIKIGRTTRPRKRFEDLLPDAILAVEPGGAQMETIRHRQFLAARRGNSEYFTQSPELLAHIEVIRADHGEPDPSWRTTENVGRSLVATKAATPTLPLLRAIAAADAAGIKRCSIYLWIRVQKLQPVDHDEEGKALFSLTDVLRLKRESPSYRDTA